MIAKQTMALQLCAAAGFSRTDRPSPAEPGPAKAGRY
jgi:hypothetical protein